MSSSTFRRTALCVLLCAAAPTLWALPTLYHLQDLGPDSAAAHIGPTGEAAGVDARVAYQAAVWRGGVVTDLPNPLTMSDAYWVNASGTVVGSIGTSTIGHAALWSSADVLTDLGAIVGGDFSTASAINDNGDCLIEVVVADAWHSYISPGCTGAGLVDLGSLGYQFTFADAINANGQVAGTSAIDGSSTGQRAYLYTAGHMKNLGVLPGYATSDGRSLNGKGHVVGNCTDSKHKTMGYFWNGKKMVSVGTLGGKHSSALAVNYFDLVVGSAQTSAQTWHPYILDKGAPGSPMRDLTTMIDGSGAGWSLNSAQSINNAGQIIVRGLAPGDNALRTAILTPID
jgi:probable HAF family extracellular repeat protein